MHDRTEAYSLLRAAGPIVACSDGTYIATTQRGVRDVLTRSKVFSSTITSHMLGSPIPLVPEGIDPPRHTEVRHFLQPHFAPGKMDELVPTIRAQCRRLIDGFIANGACDAAEEFATPFPPLVFLTWFGLPTADLPLMARWEQQIAAGASAFSTDLRASAKAATDEALSYLRALIAERKRRPAESSDLLSRLLADTSPGCLDDEELLSLVFLFLLAGLGTVSAMLTTSLTLLAQDTGLRRQIVDDPELIPAAVNELLRFDPPAPFMPRMATQDTTVEGYPIPEGALVIAAIGAANRDLPEDAAPDVIDFHRDQRQARNLALGLGPHYCLGAPLALREGEIALREWHKQIPDYSLAPGAAPRVDWPRTSVRFTSVPLVFPGSDGPSHSRETSELTERIHLDEETCRSATGVVPPAGPA